MKIVGEQGPPPLSLNLVSITVSDLNKPSKQGEHYIEILVDLTPGVERVINFVFKRAAFPTRFRK